MGGIAMVVALYAVLKWLHVLLAIVAVSANATYGIWIARSSRSPEHLAFTLRTVKLIDDRLANPAYVLLLLTGSVLLALGHWSLRTPWLLTALVLYVALVALGLGLYTPTLRQQIEAAERSGADSPAYQALASRGQRLGIVTAVLVVAITFLMVVKPGFGQ
jgi:uncharacterized membrane protein